MGTLNIGFYEEISKTITKLSSNIIKYAPYFFCWCGKVCNINSFSGPFFHFCDIEFFELLFLYVTICVMLTFIVLPECVHVPDT